MEKGALAVQQNIHVLFHTWTKTLILLHVPHPVITVGSAFQVGRPLLAKGWNPEL